MPKTTATTAAAEGPDLSTWPTREEAAGQLRISVATLDRWVRAGKLYTAERPRFFTLLFHVECAIYKPGDQHSISQAERRVYSKKREHWVRGGTGISRANYKRETAALVSDGLLIRIGRTREDCGHTASEYVPDWVHARRHGYEPPRSIDPARIPGY